MMKNLFQSAFSLLIICMITHTVHAQRFDKRKHYSSIGASIGVANYFGDLAPNARVASTDIKFTRPSVHFYAMHKFHPRFGVRGTFGWSRVKGDDQISQDPGSTDAKFRYMRNLHFRNDIVEFTASGVVDLFENRGTFLKRQPYNVYAYLGIGIIYHNPRAKTPDNYGEKGGEWVSLQPLQTEGKSYSRVQFVIPGGMGIRYRLGNRFDVAVEVGFRYSFTDYLDDVSGDFVDPAELSSELSRVMANRTGENAGERNLDAILQPLGYALDPQTGTIREFRPGEKRGNRGDRDWYVVSGIHLYYIIGGGVQCPKFR
jgi:hypothetical protein